MTTTLTTEPNLRPACVPGARLGYRPALDGLRAVAVTLVVLRHFAPTLFPGAGVVGVALFFTLSGFLITTLLLEEHDGAGRVRMGAFYLRRVGRLVPALAVMLAGYTCYALSAGVGTPRQLLVTLTGAVTYTSNLLQAAGANLLVDLGPLWSLSVEEQFYLIWPVVLIAAYRRGGSSRALRLILGVVGVAMFARAAVALTAGTGAAYTLPVSWTDAFLAGAAAALLARSRGWMTATATTRRRFGWVAAACTLVVAGFCFVPDLKGQVALYAGAGTLLAVAAALLVLAATAAAPGTGLLRTRLAVWWGRLSYSVYLYNLIAVDVIDRHASGLSLGERRLVALAVTVTAAVASYYLVERPGQALVRRLARRPRGSRVAVAVA